MTGNRRLFVTLDNPIQSEVRTGDDNKLFVEGKCDILVQTRKGEKKISDVFYVSNLKHNLLSVGQLNQKGYVLTFSFDTCTIKDKHGFLIAKVKEFFGEIDEATTIYVDNKSAIALAKNPIHHGRSKQNDVRYHFIRDAVKKGHISMEHCSTEDQVADLFTKALPTPRFLKLLKMLRMKKVLD
ncbi:Retrovirus-related Pol polyprotein from transposon TNT 1-94 [Dendrobium catenatum]|uniref:Retrovirus-related Pol polyprotein from transposon TNT 1-94 n=1 Tax=Dendrobium catenatum TaxID=906689 RepID=A0A2I0W6Q6_9ASPA|nr:Retrovirus-related Pol polyprotein from transposon TNT 1-94 [Dendrobium catenatum]